ARTLDAHALGPAAHGGLQGFTHGPAELHSARQLLGHALGNKLRIELGVLDFENVQLHLLAGQLFQVAADPIGFSAPTPDDDSRACGMDVDADAVAGALDLDTADTGSVHA